MSMVHRKKIFIKTFGCQMNGKLSRIYDSVKNIGFIKLRYQIQIILILNAI